MSSSPTPTAILAAPEPSESYIPLSAIQSTNLVEPVVIGNLVAFSMFGVSLLQFWLIANQYMTLWRSGNFKKASGDFFNCTIIFVLFLADLEDSITKGIFCDRYIRGTIIGGLSALSSAPRTAATTGVSDGVVASLTHIVYARRLLRISSARKGTGWGAWTIVGIGMAFSVVQFVGACWVSKIVLAPAKTWYPDAVPGGVMWMGGAAFVDIFFAAAFITNILQHRKDTFKETRNVIIRWTIFTIEFGVITSALQLLHLLIFIIPKDHESQAWHFGVAMVVSKAYINSILLLMRNVLANRIRNHEDGKNTSQSSGVRFQSRMTGPPGSPNPRTPNSPAWKPGMALGPAGYSAGRDRTLPSGIVVTSQTHYENSHDDGGVEMKGPFGAPKASPRWDEKADLESGSPYAY